MDQEHVRSRGGSRVRQTHAERAMRASMKRGMWLLAVAVAPAARAPSCAGAPAPHSPRGVITDIRKSNADTAEADEPFSPLCAVSDDGARGAAIAVRALVGDPFVEVFESP